MPSEVRSYSLKCETIAAVFIKMVSKYCEVAMRYHMRLLIAPPDAKGIFSVPISKQYVIWGKSAFQRYRASSMQAKSLHCEHEFQKQNA